MDPRDPATPQFASDNNAGITPEAFAALAEANRGHVVAYGGDELDASVPPTRSAPRSTPTRPCTSYSTARRRTRCRSPRSAAAPTPWSATRSRTSTSTSAAHPSSSAAAPSSSPSTRRMPSSLQRLLPPAPSPRTTSTPRARVRSRSRRRPSSARSTRPTKSGCSRGSRTIAACRCTWTARASPTRSHRSAARPRTSRGERGWTRCRWAAPRTACRSARRSCSSTVRSPTNSRGGASRVDNSPRRCASSPRRGSRCSMAARGCATPHMRTRWRAGCGTRSSGSPAYP